MPSTRFACSSVLVAALILPSAARAQAGPSARILSYGEVSATREAGARDPATVEGTGAVKVWEDAVVARQTGRIEARLCGRFGVTFVVDGVGPPGTLDVTIQSRHPMLVNPDGRGDAGVRYSKTVASGQPGVFGFTFDHPWEMVPGTWTFSVLLGNRVLAEQSFEVTAPVDAGRPPANGCSALLS